MLEQLINMKVSEKLLQNPLALSSSSLVLRVQVDGLSDEEFELVLRQDKINKDGMQHN
jgi:hypothetical protein